MRTTQQRRFALLFCFIPMTLVCGNAQIRTVTQRPYPTQANSVAWINNVPYISGAGIQQQLDLFAPTNRKNMPLIVYIHGGGYGHGDKIGDSLNPDELQLLWDGVGSLSESHLLHSSGPTTHHGHTRHSGCCCLSAHVISLHLTRGSFSCAEW
jgi:hypothetical protein